MAGGRAAAEGAGRRRPVFLEGLRAGEAFRIAVKRGSVPYVPFVSSRSGSSKEKRKALVRMGAFFLRESFSGAESR